MCSPLCLIFYAILLFIGLAVFAGLILWCDTFQLAKKSAAAPKPTPGDSNEDSEAKAKAEAASEAKASAEKDAAAAAALAKKEADTQQESESSDFSAEAGPDADGDGIHDINTATPEQAAAAFSEELDAGYARQEEKLGIIYNQRPDAVDDLKLIKGVGNTLEQKLHNSGIHRLKQIALWTDTAAREFGAKLSFCDRIFRDDWIAQAKKFHKEKYGEKL